VDRRAFLGVLAAAAASCRSQRLAPRAGRRIVSLSPGITDALFAIGDLASEAAKAFGAEGRTVADVEAARAAIEPGLAKDVTVLIKGSRVMGLDRLVRALELESRTS
jgi:UDP-N-acetylmuramyl pentapeptide synthase